MQMAGQVECKQVVKWDANTRSSQVQFPTVLDQVLAAVEGDELPYSTLLLFEND